MGRAILVLGLVLVPMIAWGEDAPVAPGKPARQEEKAATQPVRPADPPASRAGTPEPPKKPGELAELGIEDLMRIEVTTASRREQPLSSVPAAIYVITHEEIRRSGATHIPDLLRLVPGVQVAQIDANKWAISPRGFASRFADKLLVLIDGRSVYNLSFSGVYWDAQDLLLEDIERIEVIRGPGGSLWGANAVNGIINIITRNAHETLGTLVSAGLGTEERGFGALRSGGKLGSGGAAYRVYGKYFSRASLRDISGQRSADEWDSRRIGFRLDGGRQASGTWMVEGATYKEHLGQRSRVPSGTPPFTAVSDFGFPSSGYHLLSRWTQPWRGGAETGLQLYYDRYHRAGPEADETWKTLDLDLQHRLSPLGRHAIITGLGYRRSANRMRDGFIAAFRPQHRVLDLYSAFLQDEIALRKSLRLTLGSKFEHNLYTGLELLPNVRLAWAPDERRTLWAAISRAVRLQNRADNDATILLNRFPDPMTGLPTEIRILSNPDLDAQSVWAYEVGYRFRSSERLFVDIATFYNRYRNLAATEQGMPFLEPSPPPPHLVVPLLRVNGARGETYGFEVAGRYTATRHWKLALGYGFLHPRGEAVIGSARHQLSARSYLDLPGKIELDAAFYFMTGYRDALITAPEYSRLDLRVGWRPTERLEISLVGQNLLDLRHSETGPFPPSDVPSEAERSFYAKATWRL